MCGIAGFFSSSSIDKTVIQNMTDSMAHRGPDANGFYQNENKTVALGHRRLSIIDLSNAANQPMYSHCGKYVMVFNGEIFNYQEIAAELQMQFKTHSDSEVILEAFIKYGVEFVNKLNGMFAIAIYAIEKNELYLFRDRLGVKPIYIAEINQTFYFGSELKSILKAVDKKQLKVNQQAVYQFLHLGYIPQPNSIYNEIQKFPAGSFATISSAGIVTKPYWKAEEKITTEPISNFDSAKKQLKELLISSVKYRMIADVPFGTFLSGGIDSSVVTSIAQSISDKPIKTFSIGFKNSKHNEAPFAKSISDYLKTEHYEFMVSEDDALDLVDKISGAYDEPFADSSAMPTMLVSKLARQHVTMTLSGDGGDELFQGYGMYNWANRLNNPLIKTNRKLISSVLKLMPEKYKRAALVFDYETENNLPAHIFSQEQYAFSQSEIRQLLNHSGNYELKMQQHFATARKLNAAEEQALFDINFYLKDDLLVKVDRASMQFSLETRTPFLDYRLVEFALNLPYDFKVKNNVAKYILKEVLYDFVPKNYFDRPKWGFSAPLRKWMNEELKPMVENCLSEETVTTAGLVNWNEVKKIKAAYYAGESFLYYRLWILTMLHKWWLHAGS